MARWAPTSWMVFVLLGLTDGGAAVADERFAGTWQATIKAGTISTTIRVVMQSDGRFDTVVASDKSTMRIAGTYHVLDGRTIRFVNKEYAPRESCLTGADGKPACMPIDIPPEETDSYRFEADGRTLVIANPAAGEMKFEKAE